MTNLKKENARLRNDPSKAKDESNSLKDKLHELKKNFERTKPATNEELNKGFKKDINTMKKTEKTLIEATMTQTQREENNEDDVVRDFKSWFQTTMIT